MSTGEISPSEWQGSGNHENRVRLSARAWFSDGTYFRRDGRTGGYRLEFDSATLAWWLTREADRE